MPVILELWTTKKGKRRAARGRAKGAWALKRLAWERKAAKVLAEAEKRQAEFESCPTSVDYDNDCAP